ncbi:hypothetical protein E2493_02065 [Sphingomonas parva]|uniref:Uncharacterized protein n=1 Tax=Sphingomonas parva TaxID=2555898 RepID=A0A4Y8ZXS6_9SPHN|nr:hypothetical protein [Sphingomonas parva]TFI60055.1 hypothetical protein E2493_02065 [Sphingomonas parva]
MRIMLAKFSMVAAAFAAAIWAGPAPAQSAKEAAQIEAAVARGRLLYELDVAGWVSTDRMRADAPEVLTWPVRGWIVEPDAATEHSWTVTYYLLPQGEGGPAVPAYRVHVSKGKATSGEIVPATDRQPLTPIQNRIVQAIEAARKLDLAPCAPARLNVAVVPPASESAPIEVYLLTPQTKEKVFPIGGHYKAVFGSDGRLVSKRAFSKSCLNMDASQIPPDAKEASLFVTHLLDEVPTEIHVLSAIQIGVPLIVGTRDKRLWEVTPRGIRKLR